jgi:hypothetical protein
MLFNLVTLVIYILLANFPRGAYANRGNPPLCDAPLCAANMVATLADNNYPTLTSSVASAVIPLPLRA